MPARKPATPEPVISVGSGLPRPRWRGHVHSWAFYATLPAVVALLAMARGWEARLAIGTFGGCLLGMYGISAAYHRLARSHGLQRIMRRLDHSMIFLLFAATYTAVAVTSLDGAVRWAILGAVWSLTVVGIVIKTWCHERLLRISNALYAVLCAPAFLALPVLIGAIPPVPFSLLVLGGALYIVGAAVFFHGWPDPRPSVFGYHEVWHVFTVLAGTSHLGMVAALT